MKAVLVILEYVVICKRAGVSCPFSSYAGGLNTDHDAIIAPSINSMAITNTMQKSIYIRRSTEGAKGIFSRLRTSVFV